MSSWIGILGAISVLLAATACNAQQPLSDSAFRDEVAHELSRQRPDLCIRPDGNSGLNVGRSTNDCEEMQVNTAYIYRQYASNPASKSDFVTQLVTTALSGLSALETSAFTPDRSRIIAVLRPREYTSSAGPQGDPTSSIWRPFAGDFVATLVHYEGGQVRSLRGIDLEAADLREEEAWEIAIVNLRQQIGQLQRTANQSGAEHISAGSGLAPASLLLPETCEPQGPDFDVFIVARDSYFYADASKPQATAMIAGYVAGLLQSGEDVYSRRLISCLDGAWYASVFNGTNAWLPENAAADLNGAQSPAAPSN